MNILKYKQKYSSLAHRNYIRNICKLLGVKKIFFESWNSYRQRLLKNLLEKPVVIDNHIDYIEVKGTIKL